jgi:modulator of FtsH protease
VVVAISVNLSRILAFPQLPGRAGESLLTLLGALILTSLGLVPQTAARFGAEVLAVGILMFVGPLIIQLRARKFSTELSTTRRSLRMIVSAAVSLPLIAGGILLMAGSGAGVYWIAAGVILSLVAGIYGAWVLLVEILR